MVLNHKVNKNDDLEVFIDYEHDLDDLFYSLIIIYKFEVVATKSYYYNKFTFRIWDLFNDFQADQNQFLLRISLVNNTIAIKFQLISFIYSMILNSSCPNKPVSR